MQSTKKIQHEEVHSNKGGKSEHGRSTNLSEGSN